MITPVDRTTTGRYAAKRIPEVGDKIYMEGSYFLSHGWDDFEGGIATVSAVSEGVSAGKPAVFISVEERPGWEMNWDLLEKEQEKLKKMFGDDVAHAVPDTRPEFNEG